MLMSNAFSRKISSSQLVRYVRVGYVSYVISTLAMFAVSVSTLAM